MSVSYKARLVDFIHQDTGLYFSGDKFAFDIKAFREELSRIYCTFEQEGISDHGTMLLLLNSYYGIKSFMHIEYGKIDEMILWIKRNAPNFENILQGLNQKLTEYYQKHQQKDPSK